MSTHKSNYNRVQNKDEDDDDQVDILSIDSDASDIYINEFQLRGERYVKDDEERLYQEEEENFQSIIKRKDTEYQESELNENLIEQLSELDRQKLFFNELPTTELLDYLHNYKAIDWETVSIDTTSKYYKRSSRPSTSRANKIRDRLIRSIDSSSQQPVVTRKDQLTVFEYKHHLTLTLRKILDLLFIPLSDNSSVKVLVDIGPKRMKREMRAILTDMLRDTIGLDETPDWLKFEDSDDDDDEDEEDDVIVTQDGDHIASIKRSSNTNSENEAPETRKDGENRDPPDGFSVSEWLLFEVARERIQTSQRELSRKDTEIEYLKQQLESRNRTLDDVTRRYEREFQELRNKLTVQIRGSGFNPKGTDLFMMSTLGSSLSELTQLLEEERQISAKTINRLKTKYERQIEKIKVDHNNELMKWKSKVLQCIDVKSRVEEELNKLKQETGKQSSILDIPIAMEEVSALVREKKEREETALEAKKLKLKEDLEEIDAQQRREAREKIKYVGDNPPAERTSLNPNEGVDTKHKKVAFTGPDHESLDVSQEDQLHILQNQLNLSLNKSRELKSKLSASSLHLKELENSVKRLKKQNEKLALMNKGYKGALEEAKKKIDQLKEQNKFLKLQLTTKMNQLSDQPMDQAEEADSVEMNISGLDTTDSSKEDKSDKMALNTSDNIGQDKERKTRKEISASQRIKRLGMEVSTMSEDISGCSNMINNHIDFNSLDELQNAILEAENFEKQYLEKLTSWEHYLKSRSNNKSEDQELNSLDNSELTTLQNQEKVVHHMGDLIYKNNQIPDIATKLHTMSPDHSSKRVKKDQGRHPNSMIVAMEKLKLLEEKNRIQEANNPPSLIFDYREGKLRAESFDVVLRSIEVQQAKEDGSGYSLLQDISTQKKKLDNEREQRWSKIISIAQQFAKNTKLHPRLKHPVPLFIHNVNRSTRFQQHDALAYSTVNKDILIPTFSTKKRRPVSSLSNYGLEEEQDCHWEDHRETTLPPVRQNGTRSRSRLTTYSISTHNETRDATRTPSVLPGPLGTLQERYERQQTQHFGFERDEFEVPETRERKRGNREEKYITEFSSSASTSTPLKKSRRIVNASVNTSSPTHSSRAMFVVNQWNKDNYY